MLKLLCPKHWPQIAHFIVVQMKEIDSRFMEYSQKHRSRCKISVVWSPVWSSTLSAAGRPEVPTVPQTISVQGWAKLPHYGWTHNQGTPQVFFTGSFFQPNFWPTFTPKPITQRMRAHISSLSHWSTDCISQCKAIQKPVLLILYTVIADISRVGFHHVFAEGCAVWNSRS